MHKFLLSFLFILFYFMPSFAQEPKVLTLDKPNPETVVGDQIFPVHIQIEIHPTGFDISRLTLVAGIGLQSDKVDPVTGFKQFDLFTSATLFGGTLGDLKSQLATAVSKGKITQQEVDKLQSDILIEYDRLATLFNNTATLLDKAGITQLKPALRVK